MNRNLGGRTSPIRPRKESPELSHFPISKQQTEFLLFLRHLVPVQAQQASHQTLASDNGKK
jgi:hypothetical protein